MSYDSQWGDCDQSSIEPSIPGFVAGYKGVGIPLALSVSADRVERSHLNNNNDRGTT